MSLLLDALKKAAQQKKAKDSSEPERNTDSADIAGSETTHAFTRRDETALTETVITSTAYDPTVIEDPVHHAAMTDADETALTETVITSTAYDPTVVEDPVHHAAMTDADETTIDETAIDKTSTDQTLLDETELDSTILEKTQVDSTLIEPSEKDNDSADANLTETELHHTDSTQLDETMEIGVISTEDASESDSNPRETADTNPPQVEETIEIGAISFEDTNVAEDSLEPVSSSSGGPDDVSGPEETMEINSKLIDPSQLDYDEFSKDTIASDDPTELGEDFKFADSTELDVTSLDRTETKDDTELRNQSRLSDAERSMYIIDGTESKSVNAVDDEVIKNEKEAFADIQAKYKKRLAEKEDGLTEDDVTQFMGDGVSTRKPRAVKTVEESGINSDDTTLTNSESLTMTNFSFDGQDSEHPEAGNPAALNDQTESDTYSLHKYDRNSKADQTTSYSLSLEEISEDDKATRINTDVTATASSIDIEQLTNEGIVQTQTDHKTSSRPYAPDNYDRTLLNLSEKDVSNIFPGMRPDSDTVMTPDYAKRIFLSKSSQIKTRYFKLYAGIALVLLLSVVMLGLFQLQEESTQMDNGLISLKRDPMPGIIKPQFEKSSERLFVPESNESDNNMIKIISTADEPESAQSVSVQDADEAGSVVENADEGQAEKPNAVPVNAAEQQTPNKTVTLTKNKPVQASASSSTLSISSGSQTSTESQLLNEAYNAYERSDMASAKSLYNKVLELDGANRDALLGRAAIHIQDNEYQQAINIYQKLLVDNPKDSMAMTSLISVANVEPQVAETQLKNLLREQPESPYIHFVLGNMYGSQNRWNEAQTAYFEALQKIPDNPNYAYNLAVSMEHLGKPLTAIDFYKRALKNSSNGLITFDNQLVMQRIEVLAQ